MKEGNFMKFAIPVASGKLCTHFGHCEEFAMINVQGGKIYSIDKILPPPHEPGVISNWLAKQEVEVIIAGGMGERAQAILENKGIKVICGVSPDLPENIIKKYLEKSLETGINACDHDENDAHHCQGEH